MPNPRIVRASTNLKNPTVEQTKDAAKALGYVAATLESLVGLDADESALTVMLKKDIGQVPGELVQDITLLSAKLVRAIANDLKDGKPNGGDVTMAFFDLLRDAPEIAGDVAALGR